MHGTMDIKFTRFIFSVGINICLLTRAISKVYSLLRYEVNYTDIHLYSRLRNSLSLPSYTWYTTCPRGPVLRPGQQVLLK
jgi:hypothetical protein